MSVNNVLKYPGSKWNIARKLVELKGVKPCLTDLENLILRRRSMKRQ